MSLPEELRKELLSKGPPGTTRHSAPVGHIRLVPENGDRPSADFMLDWALERTGDGRRNQTGFDLACQLNDNGYTEAEAEQVVLEYAKRVPEGDHPYTEQEVRASVKQAFGRPPREPWTRQSQNGSEASESEPEKPPFELKVETAAEILALPDPPDSDMLLGPVLVKGQRTLIGAAKNAGKTTLAKLMAKAVHDGEPFLEWDGRKGRVLFVDAEQGLKSVKRKLRDHGIDGDDFDYLRVPEGLALNSDPEHIEAVERILAEGRYDVVFVDPLYKLHRGESNEERAMVDLMRLFDRWRTTYHFALVMNTHTRKDFAGRQLQMADIFGSGGVTWGAEIILGLERLSPGFSQLHFFADRDGDLPLGETWGLLFDKENGYRRDPKAGEGKRSCKDKVRDLLKDQPGLTLHELMQFTGNGERTVRDALKDLEAETMGSTADGEKMWKLPDETLL